MKVFYEYTYRNFINVPDIWTEEEIYDYLRENITNPCDDLAWWTEEENNDF